MSNELPFSIPDDDDASNALPQQGGQASAVTGRSSGAGIPMYAIAAIACGVLVIAAVLSVIAGRRYCRPRQTGRLDDDNDSLVFFAEPEGEPTLDLRLQSRAEPAPVRPAPRAPADAKQRADSAELDEFAVEAFADGDASETARLTGD